MVKTNRSLLIYILLNLITFGIYSLFFTHSWVKDINMMCEGDGQHTAGLLKLILFSILTCGIYTWVWYYKIGNRLAENAPKYELNFSENGTSVLMWMLFGSLLCGIGPFIGMHILFKNTNKLAIAYKEKQMA